MLRVPRRVREQPENTAKAGQNPVRPLEDFRGQAAWVLLGEPGAGKSASFKTEAEATGGQYIAIADFLVDLFDADVPGQTLFLDGLDETRASGGGDSILRQVRAKLKKLGDPPFRIACRAADWFGSTDREILSAAMPAGQLSVLLLEPLSADDIRQILEQNQGVSDPEAFVDNARKRGMDGLLDNPQTLGLLAQAIEGEHWPGSRQKTYELAATNMALEQNKTHRKFSQDKTYTAEQLLNAAGQLCAVMLLADKAGVALDQDGADLRYPDVAEFAPPDLEMARASLRSKLFRHAPTGEERLEPSHRSLAEFLAARWLAQQIDQHGLPLGRVLNLLLGIDGRTVAGLRGLYAWLALECQAARPRLIEADPLSVVIYGDVKPMPAEHKRRLLDGLKAEASQYAAFHRDVPTRHALGALATPELAEYFAAVLQSPERDSASQAFAGCVLDILAEGEAIPALVNVIRKVIEDGSRWETVRQSALQSWLKLEVSDKEPVVLLDDIHTGKVTDSDDELAATLLGHLFPQYLSGEKILRYFHFPKRQNLVGMFEWFWCDEFPRQIPLDQLPNVLDVLAITKFESSGVVYFQFGSMLSKLLDKGMRYYGNEIDAERLFRWLGIGMVEDDLPDNDVEQASIAGWLESHPDRYKELIGIGYINSRNHENPQYCNIRFQDRFRGAKKPTDIGLWQLAQASSEPNDELAFQHLSEAISTLLPGSGYQGLTLEDIENWVAKYPERKGWVDGLLFWEIQPHQRERAIRSKARQQELTDRKRENTKQLSAHIEAIRNGTAGAGFLHKLAGIWMNHYYDTPGDTLQARFSSFCENPEEVLNAAESGFRLCPMREDLPTVSEIIELNIENQEHFIRKPCLIGMDLLWVDAISTIESLPEDNLRRMLAFRLTYGADKTPDWFLYLAGKKPDLVAEVLVAYAGPPHSDGM